MDQSSFDHVEVARRLNTMMMAGTVHEADYGKARLRIKCGDLVTGWLPWMTDRASKDRTWWAPEVGEQVVVMSPGGDPAQGLVMKGAIYQNAHGQNATDPDVQRTDYGNGAYVEHNRKSGEMTVNTKGKLTIVAADDIHVTGDIIVEGISFMKHIHGGVVPGDGTTIEPVGNV